LLPQHICLHLSNNLMQICVNICLSVSSTEIDESSAFSNDQSHAFAFKKAS
jgi:hypothetical protein